MRDGGLWGGLRAIPAPRGSMCCRHYLSGYRCIVHLAGGSAAGKHPCVRCAAYTGAHCSDSSSHCDEQHGRPGPSRQDQDQGQEDQPAAYTRRTRAALRLRLQRRRRSRALALWARRFLDGGWGAGFSISFVFVSHSTTCLPPGVCVLNSKGTSIFYPRPFCFCLFWLGASGWCLVRRCLSAWLELEVASCDSGCDCDYLTYIAYRIWHIAHRI
jgi:hypothetical protein